MSFVRDMVKRAALCAVLLAFGVCVGALTMWLLGAWLLGAGA